MLISICDIINSLIQSIFMAWICNNIASKENKVSKVKSIFLIIFMFIEIEMFTQSKINPPLANLLMVVTMMGLLILFYRKVVIDAFIGFGLGYTYIMIFSYIVTTVYKLIIIDLNLAVSAEIQMFLFIFIPVFLSYYLFYKKRKKIFGVGAFLKSLKHSGAIIQTIDYTLIFIGVLHGEWAAKNMVVGLKAILIAVFATIYIFLAIYFAKINDKSKELEMLNEALNNKITELRKVKHDYGSEISTIYGLYQLGKYDKLGEIVKGVIEKNQATSATVEMGDNVNPIIKSVLSQASANGINVLIFDKADYNELKITDNDFLKLISNIIKNAIDAMSDTQNPIIRFNSYNTYDGVKIIIENNGPQIPCNVIEEIFNSGFTTKDNSNEDRGFGLNIVQDIINKCDGVISVESNKQLTNFKIEIPKENFREKQNKLKKIEQ